MLNDINNSSAAMQRIDADILIPGKGDPVEDGSVIFQGKTIKFAGQTKMLPKEYQDLEAYKVPVVMPGMWDSHIHYFGVRSVTSSSAIFTSEVVLEQDMSLILKLR